jgi:hypothetical protein
LDSHHIEHWGKGGESNADNLTLACTYHHALLHEGGFSIRKRADGTLEFLRPDGRVIPASGYLTEDIVDDCLDDFSDDLGDAESFRERPSMEGSSGPDGVCETPPVYYVHGGP